MLSQPRCKALILAQRRRNLAGRSVEIEFTATAAGQVGNDIEIFVSKENRGGVAPPQVTVEDETIFLELN